MKKFFCLSGNNQLDLPCHDLPSLSTRPSFHIKSSANLHGVGRTQVKKKVGRYYYLQSEQIGKGFTSSVYKAYSSEDTDLSKPHQIYAIKVMPLNFTSKSSSSSLELLQNQIQILKLIDHPNVIKCYDIYKSKTHCYIITEYCSEGCLLDLINKSVSPLDRRTKLSQDKIIQIGQQIVQGLKYLFQKGIIHRDIKPANILKGKNGWKIADFGFAIFADTEIKSRFNVGTPLYMPLEALKQNIYSPQSDIFSIGVILYQLSTGITPWQSKSEKELIRKMELIPLENTTGKNRISIELLKLIQRLCEVRMKSRMTRQQFMSLEISKVIKSQVEQSKTDLSLSDMSKQLKSIRSQAFIQRRLKPMKSMQQIHDNQSNQIKLQKILQQGKINKRNMYKVPSIAMILEQKKNKNHQQGKLHKCGELKEGGSGEVVKNNNRNGMNTPLTCRSAVIGVVHNMSSSPPGLQQQQPPSQGLLLSSLNIKQHQQQSTARLLNPKQQKLRHENPPQSKSDKQTDHSINPESDDQRCSSDQFTYIDQVSHVLLNQVHFCRFMFYLYRNSLYILLGRKSQDRLAVLIFRMILATLKAVEQLEMLQTGKQQGKQSISQLFKDKRFSITYLKSDRHELIKQTVYQYKEKYEKQYLMLKIKLGEQFLGKLEIEESKFAIQMNMQDLGPQIQLVFLKRELKRFLKQFDHNLLLTLDTFIGSQRSILSPRYGVKSGFIAANVEGLKNLFDFYKLITLMIDSERDIEKFQKSSKISVNTNYAKNRDYSTEQLRKIRDVIKSL